MVPQPDVRLKKPTLLLNSHIDTVKPVNGAEDPSNQRWKVMESSTGWAATMPEPV